MPYFGKWPLWKDLFFQSCKYNSSIDFLFFTDCEPPTSFNNASNIHFFQTTFKDYCQKASEKLGISFHPSAPLKLCDLRPFYGYLHEEYIKKYDFWGYGDVDVVWGNIRNFYTDELLNRYDVLSTHSDRISGHLALYRNNEKNRKKAFQARHWKKILTNEKNLIFDEQGFTLAYHPTAKFLWKTHKWIFHRFRFRNDWTAYNSFCMFVNKLTGMPFRRILLIERNTTPWDCNKSWKYYNGILTDLQTHEELIYLHFLCMKKKWMGDYYHYSPNGVIISFEGIQPLLQ
jgi:hypothetical protein